MGAENNTKASEEPVLLSVFPHLSKHTGLRTKDLERLQDTSPFSRASGPPPSHRPPTHNGTNTRSCRSQCHMCNAAPCTSQTPDVVRARKPDT